MGKKKNILSLIVKNRHLLVGIFTFFMLFFVLAGSLDVFASSDFTMYGFYPGQGFGNNDIPDFSRETVVAYYNLSDDFTSSTYPILTRETAYQRYQADGKDASKIEFGGTFFYLSSYGENARSGYEGDYPYSVVENVKTQSGLDITFPDNAYTLCYMPWGTADSSHVPISCRFFGSGQFAIINGYVVSDAPFTLVGYCLPRAYTQNVFIADIKEPSQNGFYCLSCPWYQTAYGTIATYVNCPMYLPSMDGASGFTNFTLESTDFDFSSDLYNFNYLLTDEIIINPNGTAPESESMYHLDFKNTAYYAGDGVQNFYHNNSFSFNEYMLDNASAFTINFEYVFSYKDDTDSIVKHYVYSQSVPLANFMGYSSRMGTGGKMAVPLNCKWFVGSGGVKLSEKLNNLIHAKKGTSIEYVYPNEVNGSPDYDIGDVILNDGAITQNTKKSLPYIITPFKEYIEVFTISSNITVTDGSYNSYTYSDSYDWLTGNYSLTSSENTKKPYEKENQLPSNYDNSFNAPSTGGNVGSGAMVQYANPTIVVQGGSGLTQAFKLDDVNIASLADTYNYIINTLGDTRDQNGFWAVLHDVYDYIPDPIWNIMLLGISTVIGITCVKVSLSLFRDK